MPSSERMPGEIFQEKMLGNTNRRFKLFICLSIYASLIFTSQVLGCSQQWELWLLPTGRITLLSGFAHHFAALRTMLWFSRFQITSGGALRVVYAALSCRWSGTQLNTDEQRRIVESTGVVIKKVWYEEASIYSYRGFNLFVWNSWN